MDLQDFAGSVGEEYVVTAENVSTSLRLEQASALANSSREGGGFRLEYSGAEAEVLPQAIYSFGRGGETLEIFIVPIGPAGDRMRYEAIFN